MKNSKNLLLSLIFSIVFLSIGFLVALLISKYFKLNLQNVIFWEGLFFLIAGSFSIMQGNPSGVFLSGLGSKDAQYHTNENLEVIRTERESTNYYACFKKHTIIKFTFSSLSIVLSGLFLMFLSLLF